MSDFKDFCKVDLQLSERTSGLHVRLIRSFLEAIRKKPHEVTKSEVRQYLKSVKSRISPSTYKNILASLKRFCRDFLGGEDLVNSFKLPELVFKPRHVLSIEQLRTIYARLKSPRDRSLFLVHATSGLRKSEVLNMDRFRNIDHEKQMLVPKKEGNESKHVWLSFYNEEAARELKAYLNDRKDSDRRLFPISSRHALRRFKRARERTGTRLTPQMLREWFCSEMGALGVADRYVDAFCGRVPKSVLARPYTDFSPERLNHIYDKAGLKVLS